MDGGYTDDIGVPDSIARMQADIKKSGSECRTLRVIANNVGGFVSYQAYFKNACNGVPPRGLVPAYGDGLSASYLQPSAQVFEESFPDPSTWHTFLDATGNAAVEKDKMFTKDSVISVRLHFKCARRRKVGQGLSN